jgi:hypothetical protein
VLRPQLPSTTPGEKPAAVSSTCTCSTSAPRPPLTGSRSGPSARAAESGRPAGSAAPAAPDAATLAGADAAGTRLGGTAPALAESRPGVSRSTESPMPGGRAIVSRGGAGGGPTLSRAGSRTVSGGAGGWTGDWAGTARAASVPKAAASATSARSDDVMNPEAPACAPSVGVTRAEEGMGADRRAHPTVMAASAPAPCVRGD